MTTVRRSLAYSAADSYLSVALQLASTMIIARLLTPTELGIYAVAAVFAAFATTFRDFGVAEYLIQEHDLTHDKIRAALAANIGVSWLMALILFSLSGPISTFYRQAGVAQVMQVQSINFLLIPFGAVTMAYFRRQMNFRPIFLVGITGNLISFATSTTCAYLGFGYMSLAWASLAGTAATVSASLLFRPRDFPKLPGLTEIRGVVKFGKHVSGIYILGQAGKSAPEVIIGRALDMPSVAFFSRATGLIELFHRSVMRAILPVCLPYFAKSRREEGTVLPGYLRSISYLTAIGWPFFAFLAISAWAAVRLVYGPQWAASVPLAQVLCCAAMIDIVFLLAKEVIIAAGRVESSNLLQFCVQGARITGLFAVIPFGLTGASWGLFAAAIVGAIAAKIILSRTVDLKAAAVIAAVRPSIYVTVLSIVPVTLWALVAPVSEENYLRFFFGSGAMTGAVWLIAVRQFLPTTLWAEIRNITMRFAR